MAVEKQLVEKELSAKGQGSCKTSPVRQCCGYFSPMNWSFKCNLFIELGFSVYHVPGIDCNLQGCEASSGSLVACRVSITPGKTN